MKRYMGLFALGLVGIVVIGMLYLNLEQKEKQSCDNALSEVQLAYNAAMQTRDTAMRLAVQEVVYNKDVINSFAAGVNSSDPEQQAQYRADLYRKLYPTYKRLVEANVLQFHFHDAQGHSYLRFHQPDTYDDDLSHIRPSIAQIIRDHQPINGYEIGVLAGGFRFLHPIMQNKIYLGSVEISVTFNALRQSMAELLSQHEYSFLVRNTALAQMPEKYKSNYEISALSTEYAIEDPHAILPSSPPKLSQDAIQVLTQLANNDELQKMMSAHQSGAFYTYVHHQPYMLSLLAINDVEQKHVGYIIAINHTPSIATAMREFVVSSAISTLFIVMMGLLLWRTIKEGERRAEERQQLQTISDTMGDGLYVMNNKGFITFVNPAACKELGFSDAELIGKRSADIFYVDEAGNRSIDPVICPICAVLKTGIPFRGEWRFMNKSDQLFPVEVTSKPIIQNNQVTGSVTVFRNISERKRVEAALMSERANAERANQAKSEFLSSMSHELRTPLNAIIGFGQLLESDPIEPLTKMQSESVHRILSAANHLLKLINEILDLSRIEAGQLQLSIESVNLYNLIAESVTLIQPMVESHHLTLDQAWKTIDNVYISADYTRFKQVLLNLLSNAIKYNRLNGKIILSTEKIDAHTQRISVKDTGIGMNATQLENLFQSFNRVGAERTAIEGTGIGLAITKKIIESMHGRIGVNSQPGQGSDFWIDIPLAPTPTDCEALLNVLVDHTEPQNTQAIPENKLPMLLYIEDNPDNLLLIERIMSRLPKITLISAATGTLGHEMAISYKPDIILMDVNLPGMTGIEIVKSLRMQPDFAKTPMIALSANAMSKDIEIGKQAGFNDYLTKPLDVAKFTEVIKKHLQQITERKEA